MTTFKHTAPAGDPQFGTSGNMDSGLSGVEMELAAIGVEDSAFGDDSKWDGVIAVMVLLDDKDDDTESLKDELSLFRRENDFDLD